jgi:ABC-2 type transport system permease protein
MAAAMAIREYINSCLSLIPGINQPFKTSWETAVAIALANPMQVFRTATMMLFDPQLVLLGPTAYVILDNFSQAGYIAYAIIYPIVFGTLCAGLGYFFFKRSDLP